jgi:hypothetical protein
VQNIAENAILCREKVKFALDALKRRFGKDSVTWGKTEKI